MTDSVAEGQVVIFWSQDSDSDSAIEGQVGISGHKIMTDSVAESQVDIFWLQDSD